MDLLRSLKFALHADEENPSRELGIISVRQNAFIDVFPGPAFLVTEDLEILQHNDKAKPVLQAFEERQEELLIKGINEAIRTKSPSHEVLTFGEGEAVQVIDLTLFPLSDREGVLLATGKNVTLQRNLVNALITSRQLFKDLVTCTAEFVWETDQKGYFRYVSPRGAIGYTAAELDGRVARKLIVPPETIDEDDVRPGDLINPFESQYPLEDQLIWLRDKSEGLACMRISSIPIFDEEGNWIGCRGAGQDITEEMSQRAHLDRLAAQDKMLSRIIDAIRQEIDPKKLFEIAARGTCDALNSTRIWMGRRNLSGELEIAFKLGVEDNIEKCIFNWFEMQTEYPLNEYTLVELEEEGRHIFISPIFSGDQVDGIIALVRRQEATELEESEIRLLRLMSDHLGVALVQIKAREKLEKLSRTDELSGLLNRRAFHEDVIIRLEHSKRAKNESALFYIDLDNFKPVNDKFGHEKGDEVLVGVSKILSQNTRVEDMVSRLGGDEFALWLEDIPKEMAIKKAEELQEHCRILSKKLGILDPMLSFSIGIAMVTGNRDETLDELLAAADAAMYVVKEQGKGAFSIADKSARETGEK